MGFNRENYARIKSEYDGKYLRAEEEARFRKSEIHSLLPEVARIDAALASNRENGKPILCLGSLYLYHSVIDLL